MSVYVVKTNELCSACIYLPAEDVPDPYYRATAIEINDLCTNCLNNEDKLKLRPLCEDEIGIRERVRKTSPWLKAMGWV